MRKTFRGLLLLGVCCPCAVAVPVGLFNNTDRFIEDARDIMVAECISVPPVGPMVDGIRPVEVSVLRVLKGRTEPGSLRVVTIYKMNPGTKYLLSDLGGGQALGTNYVFTRQLSVVPLPQTFELDDLDGKDLKEQVQYLFALHLYEVEQELAPLLKEKELLEKGIRDRAYVWYASDGPVQLGPIVEAHTQAEEGYPQWLGVRGEKLQWSWNEPGKSGYFYFGKVGENGVAYWEFSSSNVSALEELANKSLKARFYGRYTPGRAESPLGWTGPYGIDVKVGQTILARTKDQPKKVYAIQVLGQGANPEAMTARYTVIQN